ncbi:MAG TPA: LCP family protein [Candidatus Dormibacteraeota bacterium]|nr:LCP family protein [Candidatus Dormibacteraeota bacterium]
MSTPTPTPKPSPRRLTAAAVLDLIVPGAGHLLLGRRRAALLFFTPIALLLAGFLGLYASGGFTAILAFAVTPGVLPAFAIVNIALGVWRLAAGVDATRATPKPWLAIGVVGPAMLILVLVPHLWLGSTIAATSDFLDSTFANGPEQTDAPVDTPPPGWTFDPGDGGDSSPAPSDPGASIPPGASPTVRPTPRPVVAQGSGTGNLPGLNVSVPWTRPGAVPWGNDGRFDLLLMGSDAGRDRWSRRMDVMLLVEVDVNTGKVAMIGLPRNLINAPLPPGAARDAVACGCYSGLLNGLYVEATVIHPDRWPGTGAVAGIGAVRATVSQLTGRPVDAVLVVDLWGMIKVVDAMGGIDINIPSPVYDANYPDPVYGHIVMSLPAGQQHLDGRHALFYARSRHQDSDYGRMERQQNLLLAVRRQIGPDTILNAPDLFAAARGFVWTDLPRSALPNLVDLFAKAQSASVKQLRIVPPTYPEWLTKSEITRIQAAIANLLGLPVPPTPTPTAAPSVVPGHTSAQSPEPTPTESPSPPPAPG